MQAPADHILPVKITRLCSTLAWHFLHKGLIELQDSKINGLPRVLLSNNLKQVQIFRRREGRGGQGRWGGGGGVWGSCKAGGCHQVLLMSADQQLALQACLMGAVVCEHVEIVLADVADGCPESFRSSDGVLRRPTLLAPALPLRLPKTCTIRVLLSDLDALSRVAHIYGHDSLLDIEAHSHASAPSLHHDHDLVILRPSCHAE